MSPIGRVFVVLNLVLSVAFLGWASAILARSDEYMQKYNDSQAELASTRTDLESQITTLEKRNTDQSRDLETARVEKTDLEGERDRLNTDLARQQQTNQQLRGQIDEINSKLQGFNETIADLTSRREALQAEKDRMRDERESAVASQEDAEASQAAAEDHARDLDLQVAGLERRLASLTADKSGLETQLAALQAHTGVSLAEVTALPLIRGHVLNVAHEVQPGLVALSVGSSQGVKRGFEFHIYDRSTYKGRVVVETVEDNMCAARIESAVAGTSMTKGDTASTRI